jgi:YD repeat-containing protein
MRRVSSTEANTLYTEDMTHWLIANPVDQTVRSVRNHGDVTRRASYDYYPNGLLKTATRQPGNPFPTELRATAYERDPATWNVTHVVAADPMDADAGQRESFIDYDSEGVFPIRYRNALGHTTQVEYDFRTGQLLTSMDPNGRVVQRSYDPFGRVRKEVLPTHSVITEYGGSAIFTEPYIGILPAAFLTHQRVAYPDGDYGAEAEVVVDAFGRGIREHHTGLDGQIIVTSAARDWAGRITTSVVPYSVSGGELQGAFNYAYDGLGRLNTVTWPDGVSTEYDYASLANIDASLSGLMHDEAIWLTTLHDRRGQFEVGVLDFNRAPLDVAQVPYELWVTTSSPAGTIADLRAGGAPVTSYSYDEFDQLTGVTDPDGDMTAISYDRVGRRQIIAAEGVDHYIYNAFDELTEHWRGYGVDTQFKRDALGRTTEVRQVGRRPFDGYGERSGSEPRASVHRQLRLRLAQRPPPEFVQRAGLHLRRCRAAEDPDRPQQC